MKDFSCAGALKQKILPAVTFNRLENVLPVTAALLKGGLQVMEIQLRTTIALKAVAAIRKEFWVRKLLLGVPANSA